jgi:predicted permease
VIHAARSLAKARSFTFVCVVSLGIGMGTVIGILIAMRLFFGPPALINTENLTELLMRPQGELIAQRGVADEEWSYPDFQDLRQADTGMTITAWTVGQSEALLPAGGTRQVPVMYVSENYFNTLGVTLAQGAGFPAGVDDDAAAQPSVIVRRDFWRIRLGSDPNILGKTIRLNRVPHVVVGVAPEWFVGHLKEGGGATLWVPLRQHPRLREDETLLFNRKVDWVRVHGRLSPGESLERANAAVGSLMSGLAEQYPDTNKFESASVENYHPMGAAERFEFVALQGVALGLAGMVLLIVCLNVSGMMLVRDATRQRELSIRQAVGAGRGQLIRYLLCEAAVLAALAGCLALIVILGGLQAATVWFLGSVPPEIRVDPALLGAFVGICVITTLMFGLLPAVRFSRADLVSTLKDEAGGGGRRAGRAHRLAAALQLGIAVPFLVMGGVLLDNVRTTASAELGFEPGGLIAAPIDLDTTGVTRERSALLQAARDILAQAAGVSSVGIADGLPLDFRGRGLRVTRENDSNTAFLRPTRVDEGYLGTMGITLQRGRAFTAQDGAESEPVTVIAESVATRLFPGDDALGKRLVVTLEDRSTRVVRVVGVIADLVGAQMSTPRGELLLPLAQHPVPRVFLMARGPGRNEAMALAPAFRNALRDLDPDFNAAFASRHTDFSTALITGETLVRNSMNDMLGQSRQAGIAGAVALLLAALGVYGVVGFMVAGRTREIAVRIALGASRGRVLRTLLLDTAKLVAPGVAIGLIIAIFVVRNSFVSWYALGGVEPLVYAVAVAIAVGVALGVSLPSARRAASVSPILAMRSE